ncbi:MAG: sporulation protein YqfD [Butyricicoccus sp.]
MIGRLWLLACGQVRVRVTGASLTRFLNLCAAQGITLRQMDRTAWNELHATLSIRDFRTLRRHMGRTGCRVHILRKRGLPFLAARLRPRTALWGGAVFAAALCWLLGTHVWAIQTEIAPAIDETSVMQQLSEMGVRIGMPIKKLNTRQIRWKMMQLQPNITFFSLNLRGNSLTVVAYGSTDPPEVLDEHAITKVVARGTAWHAVCARGTAWAGGERCRPAIPHQRSCRAHAKAVPHRHGGLGVHKPSAARPPPSRHGGKFNQYALAGK